jgi:hypothetical protein
MTPCRLVVVTSVSGKCAGLRQCKQYERKIVKDITVQYLCYKVKAFLENEQVSTLKMEAAVSSKIYVTTIRLHSVKPKRS